MSLRLSLQNLTSYVSPSYPLCRAVHKPDLYLSRAKLVHNQRATASLGPRIHSNPRSNAQKSQSLRADFRLHISDQTIIPHATVLPPAISQNHVHFVHSSNYSQLQSPWIHGDKVPRPTLGHQLEVQARSAACPGRCHSCGTWSLQRLRSDALSMLNSLFDIVDAKWAPS